MRRLASPARVALLVAIVIVLVWAARVDVPRLTGGIKGDEATYVSMALSVARDGDLEYQRQDYQRFRELWHQGPDGIFLKRSGHPESLGYGKSFAYGVAAAPFVVLFGLNGLLIFNLTLLALCVWSAVAFCRARIGSLSGGLLGVAFIAASVVPVYAAWLTPELLNVTLVIVAFGFWSYRLVARSDVRTWLRRPGCELVGAGLLGVATYSKVWNGPLVGAFVLSALVARQWMRAAMLSAIFVATTAGLFGVNALVTGEWNFQGGDRRYFYGPVSFPFDERGTTFDTPGASAGMATNEANDEKLLDPKVIARLLPLNSFYFLIGRDAGLVPYFFPGVVILLWWLVRWRRMAVWQVATALAGGGAALGILIFAPALWNGGGGPVGNRYFLSIYPTLLFLLPAGASAWPAMASLVAGLTFVGPILLHPFTASHAVWLNPERWPLRLLPIELTIMEQLPVRLNIDRARVEVSKDPQVFLYYMDSNTGFQEPQGFWVKGPGTADIVIRTEFPLTRLDLKLSSPIANEVDISVDGRSSHVSLQPNEEVVVQFRPDLGVYAYASWQVVWRIRTAAGFLPQQFDPHSTDFRHLGVFIKPVYEVKRLRE